MKNKGLRLIKFARQLSQDKFQSFSPFFRRSRLFSDNLHDDGANLDDWELIEVLDQEFGGEKDDDDVDMIDLIEVDDPHSPFMCFAYNPKIKTIKYTILSKVDVGRILDGKIATVSTVLSLSRSEAIVLLDHFKWGVSRVHDEWLASEENVRKALGLFERPVVETSDKDVISCSLCQEGHSAENLFAVSCGHQICGACWTGYVSEAINDGPGCLTLRCPSPLCEAAVGIGLIELVSNQDDLKRFNDYLINSYVTGSRKTKWCPAPGCEYAAVAFSSDTDRNNEVTCKCLHSFCWNCYKEAHAPIDCVTVDEWRSEGLVQSNNWLLAKARPCPKCEKLIEKDSCKRYSHCTLCNYEFREDAFSECDSMDCFYIEQSDYDNDGMKMAAGSSLKRYNRYYEGWSCSEAARANALTDYKVLKEIRMGLLCGYLGMAESELEFLVEGHVQVVSCYRLLKWMYTYNYYQPEEEFLKRNLVEFMLEQAVTLVRMLEKHVNEFEQDAITGEIPPTQFYAFRGGLIQLTRVTRNYFGRLVEAMYKDLSEVVSISRASPERNTDEASCSSPGISSSPTRRVIRTDRSPVVNITSQVLIPGTFSQKDTFVSNLKLN